MKHSNSKTRLLIALGLALALVPGLALAQEEAEAEEGPQPTELIVTPAELELEVGDSLTLEAEVRDSEATGQLSGCKESISTGQVGSTCSCVESTMT